MDNKSSNPADNEKVNQHPQDEEQKDPSIENGKKAIKIQKELEGATEEDNSKDANKWRNEG